MYSKNYLMRERSHHKQKVLLCQAPEKSEEHQRTATPPVLDAFVDNLTLVWRTDAWPQDATPWLDIFAAPSSLLSTPSTVVPTH